MAYLVSGTWVARTTHPALQKMRKGRDHEHDGSFPGAAPTTAGRGSRSWQHWRRWVAANAGAEGVGLGGVALLMDLLGPFITSTFLSATLLLAALIVASGALLESGLVGLLQWRVVRTVLPISRHRWVRATMAETSPL